jgi:class 3 adenylate cyclase
MAESEVTERLAAVLAADAAGTSRLMETDEHATVAALDEARATFRKHIETNRGRVTHQGPAAPLLSDLDFRKDKLWV